MSQTLSGNIQATSQTTPGALSMEFQSPKAVKASSQFEWTSFLVALMAACIGFAEYGIVMPSMHQYMQAIEDKQQVGIVYSLTMSGVWPDRCSAPCEDIVRTVVSTF